MKLKVWGARGSIPAPGPETMRYGGNTSCVEVTLSDGSTLILDAGTGSATWGWRSGPRTVDQPIHILLTHLHLDHIQGLMFFAPLFRPESEIIIWGPASPEASLRDRIARYISAPLAPVEVRELPVAGHRSARPSRSSGRSARRGSAPRRSTTAGPTLGYRIEDAGRLLAVLHPRPRARARRAAVELDDEWISGFDLAHGASMLIHDCQYTDREYPTTSAGATPDIATRSSSATASAPSGC